MESIYNIKVWTLRPERKSWDMVPVVGAHSLSDAIWSAIDRKLSEYHENTDLGYEEPSALSPWYDFTVDATSYGLRESDDVGCCYREAPIVFTSEDLDGIRYSPYNNGKNNPGNQETAISEPYWLRVAVFWDEPDDRGVLSAAEQEALGQEISDMYWEKYPPGSTWNSSINTIETRNLSDERLWLRSRRVWKDDGQLAGYVATIYPYKGDTKLAETDVKTRNNQAISAGLALAENVSEYRLTV